ncbi:MAG: uridine kinase [Caldilineaceae bacterium]
MTTFTPFIIGVAGGSGSGKTTVSHHLQEIFGSEIIAYLQHDSYYHDLSYLTSVARAAHNYDHPDSLDTALLVEHLQRLRQGKPVAVPIYDFATHTRSQSTRLVAPAPIILVEGILILAERALYDLMDLRIYIDTDADLRFIRRLQRDVRERGRTVESVIEQYLATVRPMHLQFVEASRRSADVIIPEGGKNQVALEMIVSRLQAVLERRQWV